MHRTSEGADNANHLNGKPLKVFRYESAGNWCIVTTFEDHTPEQFARVSAEHDPHPPDLPVLPPAWHREGYEYHAYLPKDRQGALNYHIFSHLRQVRTVMRDGKYHLDDATCKSWSSFENNISLSITCVADGILTSIEDSAPPLADHYGYLRGHKTMRGLRYCLTKCRSAFLFRWAYFMYCFSLRSAKSAGVDIPPWVEKMSRMTQYAWVDSLLDAVHQQMQNRNFVGTLLNPGVYSVKWAKHASSIGVPIWVSWSWSNNGNDYQGMDGLSIVQRWRPTPEQVLAASAIPPPAPESTSPPAPSISLSSTSPLPSGSTNIPPRTTPSAPVLRPGCKFVPSWEDFFRNRDEADKKAEEVATPLEKQQWENRRRTAKGFSMPGNHGPRVFIWEGVEGGYIWELVNHKDVESVWDDYRRREMLFNARANVWDLCPMLAGVERDDGQELDELDDAEDALGESMDRWFSEPDKPAQVPSRDDTELSFLYRRYGLLTVEPTTTPENVLQLTKPAARRITGLTVDGVDDGLAHLSHFITSVLRGQLPDGHCDLTPTSPDNERFSSSSWGVIDRILRVTVPDLGGALFACTPRDNRNKILIHDPLMIIEMGCMKVQTYWASIVDYLLHNGSQFTVLSEETEDVDTRNVHILTFPVRPLSWHADQEDYRIYMSRLKTFLTQRPHVAASALTRGGIAWRLTREVLGIDIDLVLNGPFFKGQASAVNVADFPQWRHDVDEGEWFFLVGGYDISTGSLVHW